MFKGGLSLLRFVALAICIELPLVMAYAWMSGDFATPRFNVWPISEWLINYQAGFVRRGFVGELLLLGAVNGSLIKSLYILTFCLYATYVVLFLGVYWKASVRNPNVLLLAVLIQGGIFNMGMSADFYTRKEIIFLIFFAIQCLLYLQYQTSRDSRREAWLALYLVVVLTFSPVMVLIHEAYLFMGFPISALLLWLASDNQPQLKTPKICLAVLSLELVLIFMICSVFHGDFGVSQKIWDSLPFVDRQLLAPSAPYSVFGAIGSLGWGLGQHLTTIYGVLSSGGVFVWIFFAFGNALTISYIALSIGSGFESRFARSRYWGLIGRAALVLSPMFLVASDWGRWIAVISNQLILLMFVLRVPLVNQKPLGNAAEPSAWCPNLRVLGPILFFSALAFSLFFRMPECCAYYADIFPPFGKYFDLLRSM
jgi:hypothetical protein